MQGSNLRPSPHKYFSFRGKFFGVCKGDIITTILIVLLFGLGAGCLGLYFMGGEVLGGGEGGAGAGKEDYGESRAGEGLLVWGGVGWGFCWFRGVGGS